MKPLQNKSAVVTGGSRGIGAAAAIALAEAGATVLLTYVRSEDAAKEVVSKIEAAGGQASIAQVDVTEPDQIAAFADVVRQRLGKVDILFNNAGDMLARQTLEEVSVDDVRKTLDLNVTSLILVTQALLPLMGEGGSIINMSSLAARTGGGPGSWLYATSKGAALTLTRGWANELSEKGIRVNAVAPGVIDTDFHHRHTDPALLKKMTDTLPARKVGECDDVARAVVYLAGEGAGFITGACIDINGGMHYA